MRSESVRLRLPKGKSLFISAAIATLLVQPLYMSLSNSTAFAATNTGDFTVAQEESNMVTVDIQGDQNKDGTFSGTVNVVGAVTAQKGSTIADVDHTLTITPPGGGSTTLSGEVRTTETISTATYILETLESDYLDGAYTVNHSATYTITTDGNAEEVNDSISKSFTVDNLRPTATLLSPTETVNSRTFTVAIYATARGSDTIDRIEARLLTEDGKLTPHLQSSEGSTLEQVITVEADGRYYIEYKAFTSEGKSSTLQTYTFTIDTPPTVTPGPEVPETPEVPEVPTEPETPITPADPPVEPDEELRNEDDEPEDDEDDKDDIEDTLLGAATFSTGLVGNADPFFTEIIGGPTIPLDNNSQGQGSEDDGSTSSTSTNTAEVDERGVVQFLGISWYWWVAMIAGATSIWSLVIAGRNRMTEGGL